MRGLILAAGRGSRMGPKTDSHPKCLIELAGKTLLQWQLDAFRGAGITETAIVTGYRAEAIHVPDIVRIQNDNWAETNMVMSLACASDWLTDSTCIISYSDIVYGSEIVRSLANVEGNIVVSYDTEWLSQWRARFDDPLSDAETFRVDSQNRLLEIGGKADSTGEIHGQYMGLLKVTTKGWHIISTVLGQIPEATRRKIDMTSLLSRLIGSGQEIRAVPVNGGWFEIDSERDLSVCVDLIERSILNLHGANDRPFDIDE